MKVSNVKVQRSKRLDKKEFYFEHIKRWQESGLSQEKYCQGNDVKLSTFGYWRNKFIEPNQVEQVFTQIKIKEPTRPKIEAVKKHHADSLIVIMPNGIELVLPIETTEQRLTSLAQSLWSVLC